MSKSFTSCDPVSHKGQTNTWFTPREIIDSLGEFDLDPCTQTYRPFDTANAHFCEDEGADGLMVPWVGRVWLNPPYGRGIGDWLARLREHGDGIALVFSRTDTRWAQDAIGQADAVNFISGRLSFMRANGDCSSNAGVGSMLLAYGEKNVSAIANVEGVLFRKSQAIAGSTPTESTETLFSVYH